MRNPKRIPIIIKFFKENPLELDKFCGEEFKDHSLIIKSLKDRWKTNIDQRMGQLLINLDLTVDGSCWYLEEVDWLIEHGYFKFEELHFWGTNFYKNGKRKPKTVYKLLKDLDLDHIENIIKFNKERGQQIDQRYLKYFYKRIQENI